MSTAGGTMAKQRRGVVTRVDEDVLEECRKASALVGMSILDYLSDRLREAARRDIDAFVERHKSDKGKPKR